MPKKCRIFKWNPDPAYTANFSITTKFLELAGTSLPFNVYNMGITCGRNVGDVSIADIATFTVYYRLSDTYGVIDTDGTTLDPSVEGWADYGNITLDWHSSEPRVRYIQRKLTNIKGIQFKINGYVPEAIYINDVIVNYRPLRVKSVVAQK